MKANATDMLSTVAALLKENLNKAVDDGVKLPNEAVEKYQSIALEKINEVSISVKEVSHSAIDKATIFLEEGINKGVDKLPFVDQVKDTLKNVTKGLCSILNVAGRQLVDHAVDGTSTSVSSFVKDFGNIAKCVVNGISGFLKGDKTKDQVSEDVTKSIKETLSATKANVVEKVGSFVEKLKGEDKTKTQGLQI